MTRGGGVGQVRLPSFVWLEELDKLLSSRLVTLVYSSAGGSVIIFLIRNGASSEIKLELNKYVMLKYSL